MSRCKKCLSPLAIGSACLVCLGASRFDAPSISGESVPITMSMAHDPHGIQHQIKQELAMRPVAAITTNSTHIPRFISAFTQWAPEPQGFISPMPRMSPALLWGNATTMTKG